MLSELALKHWKLLAENIGKGDLTTCNPPTFPKGEQKGFGFHEAPRGTLSHWCVIENGKIKDAFSSGTMVRLLEEILKGRDPRDAWAYVGRVCGVCTSVHSLTSVRAVEDALGIKVPPNAEMVRNIMYCAQAMHDHVVHFYHLHALDWVNPVNALKADPKKTSEIAQSISHWPKSSPGYFADLQARMKKVLVPPPAASRDEILAMRNPLAGYEAYGPFGVTNPREILTCAYEEVTTGT